MSDPAMRDALEKARHFLMSINGGSVTDRPDLLPGASPETLAQITHPIDAGKVLDEIDRALGLNVIPLPRS